MNSYESLLTKIRSVRMRWRLQVLTKGISFFVVSVIALLVLGVWGGDLFGFSSASTWVIRLLTGSIVLGVAWYFLYRPLSSRITDIQVAQYIEEKYTQLQDRLVTAVEYGKKSGPSSGMTELLIQDALNSSARIDFSAFVNRPRLVSFGALGILALLSLFALLNWGPSFFPYGFSRLYVPWTEASLGSAMMIKIIPGDAELAKGSDQQIQAQLIGFDSPDVRLYLQSAGSKSWNSSPMESNSQASSFQYLLVDVRESLQYYVESKGIRSKVHSLRVLDQARVEKIDLIYNFPSYTGMADQTVQNEGDISALKGTLVRMKIHLSRPADSARLVFDNQSTLELSRLGPQDFTGAIRLQQSGSYVVQIAGALGNHHAGSPEYGIEAIEDGAPKISITRPMRDIRATNVEEVFSEVKAEDDIGMGKLELHYSVNGGPEKTINLYSGKPAQAAIVGTHTFFLEEFGLQPGDVISYFARGADNNTVTGPSSASSDIYFIQIRPFDQKYKQSQQGGMQAQGGDREEALSKQQKDLISATFKLIREKAHLPQKEFQDSLKSLALVQSRLQAQAQNVVDRMQRRGAVQADETFRKLSDYLKGAIQDMEKAAADLGSQNPESAMPKEQKSLQQLMRAESLFREIQVSFANQSGNGNGAQANAEDLADLFELELNKLKNQYETVQRGEQQARDQKLDEALEKLKELAQRQQQLNERNRMMNSGRPSSSGGGSGSQNQEQLLQQAEQLQRQLQRLSRERSSPQLNEAGGQIQKAIEEMKRALGGSRNQNNSEAAAQGMRALQQLEDAARKLTQNQQSGLTQGLDKAVEESKNLLEEQKRIQEGLDRLSKNKKQPGASESEPQLREDIVSRKTNLADRLRNLGNRIQDMSRQSRKAEKETSSKLADAAGTIQDNRLPERIVSGNPMIQNGYYEGQKTREDFIQGSLEALSRQLESARRRIGQTREGKLEEAANKARQLSEGLESMLQRMNEDRSGQNGSGQPPAGQGKEPGRSSRGGTEQAMQNGRPNPDADVRNATRNSAGAPTGIGVPRNEEARQLSRELQQRLMDAQELRPLLGRSSTQIQNLEKVIDSLRKVGDYVKDSNPEQLARLRSAIDSMRKVELNLARDLDRLNQSEKYSSAEDSASPESYRKLVEEYYRAIAK